MALIQRNTAYSVNDIVNTKFGIKLKCTTAGTTDTDPLILDGTSPITDGTVVWEVQEEGGSGQGLVDYAPNTSYNVGDIVLYDDKIFRCITAHTSTSTFDDTKWICISGGEISNGLEIVDLWSGTFSFNNSTDGAAPSSSTPMIELSDSIQNYEYLYVVSGVPSSDEEMSSSIVTVSEITVGTTCFRIGPVGTGNIYTTTSICFYDNTHIYIKYKDTNTWSVGQVKLVQGIRKAKPIVSSGMKYEVLWEGEAGSISANIDNIQIQLSESIKKYKKIGITYISGVSLGNRERWKYGEIDTDSLLEYISSPLDGLANKGYCLEWGYGNEVNIISITQDSTDITLVVNIEKIKITKITGISEGVQIPTGVQAARVTLWEGFNNTLNSVQTLSDSIENYDQFEVTYANNGNGEFQTHLFNVSDINNFSSGVSFHCDGFASWGNPPYYFVLTFDFVSETTWKLNSIQGNGWSYGITKIVGIKYIQPDSYSTEEKLIGTWIDGKPLYRKVFENVSNGYNTGLTTALVNPIKIYGGVFDSSFGNTFLPNETNYLYLNSSGLVQTNKQGTIGYVAVEYTKY